MGTNKNRNLVYIYLLSGKNAIKVVYMGVSFLVPVNYEIIRIFIENGYFSLVFPFKTWKEELREKIGNEKIYYRLIEKIMMHLAYEIIKGMHDVIPPKIYAFSINIFKAPPMLKRMKKSKQIIRGNYSWIIIDCVNRICNIIIIPTDIDLFKELFLDSSEETKKMIKKAYNLAKKIKNEELKEMIEEALASLRVVEMITGADEDE